MPMPALPQGVCHNLLAPHPDGRGTLVELFRHSFPGAFEVAQWNGVTSSAGVMRGVHVHLVHWDYLIVLSGRALVGLRDLREGSPTSGESALVEMRGDAPASLTIPPGVAHGFLFPEASLHVYGVSHVWNQDDELGCHWRDPELRIPWPVAEATVSPRDAALPPLAFLLRTIAGSGSSPVAARP